MTGTEVTIDERNALFGILSTENHDLDDKTLNEINMILLAAKMCISVVEYKKYTASLQYLREKWYLGNRYKV